MRVGTSTLVAITMALATTNAAAQSTTPAVRSAYEEESLVKALAETHSVPEPAPEGKILERIDVVPLDVIEERDPAPGLLNMFHITTRAGVIRREVLLKVGEPYKQYLVDDSTRVLRAFRQVSLVIAVPTKGSTPDRVRLLLVTKDVWSLRAQSDFGIGPKGIDWLRLEPTERNVGGTFDSIFARFELFPATLTFGGGVYIPRLDARPLYFSADANVIVNRDHGHVEGTYGTAVIRRPLLSARQSWYWALSSSWRSEIRRRYLNADVAPFDAPSTLEVERLPDAYRARSYTENVQLTRSYGLAAKQDLTVGAEINVREFHGYDPRIVGAAVANDYRRLRTPTSDTRAGPYAEARVYESQFLRTYDLDTLGLGEDYRLGYDASLRVYPVLRALGSSRSFFGTDAVVQYTVRVGKDGIGRATAETLIEAQTNGFPVRIHAGNAAFYSPRFFLGRLVVDGLAILRPDNYLNIRSTVGGESRLRGQPSGALLGANLIAFSTELRTHPLHILASQLGGALFFDVADASDTWPPKPKSSAGVGVRVVLPQLDRQVIRFDVGFPIQQAPGAGAVGFYFALDQAFALGRSDGQLGILGPLGTGALGQ